MSIDQQLAILQAAKDGKQLQIKKIEEPASEWRDSKPLIFSFGIFDYRVKPEPREWWIHKACGLDHDPKLSDYIKVREVLE